MKNYIHKIQSWPREWEICDADIKTGQLLIATFKVFIEAHMAIGTSDRKIRSHLKHLFWLGGNIVERLNDGDEENRKLPIKKLILKYVNEEGGPLLHFLDVNESADFKEHVAYDRTCRQLHKFILGTK
jgi:hypothetical protein